MTVGDVATPGGDPPAGSGRRRHPARWIALGVGVVAVGLVGVLATRPSAQAEAVQSPLIGHEAPAIVEPTAAGQPFSLESYRGRWVVLDFFASWCGPCREEEPALEAFAWEHRAPGGVALIGVPFNDDTGTAAAWSAQQGATWPIVSDPGYQIGIDYGVRGQPETFVVDPNGLVVAHLDGALTRSELDEVLTRAKAVGA